MMNVNPSPSDGHGRAPVYSKTSVSRGARPTQVLRTCTKCLGSLRQGRERLIVVEQEAEGMVNRLIRPGGKEIVFYYLRSTHHTQLQKGEVMEG